MPQAEVAILTAAQRDLLRGGLLLDRLADGRDPGGPREKTGWDAARLLCDGQRRLLPLFPPASPVWTSLQELLKRQAASARWELEHRGRRQPLDRSLLRRLGNKAALMRWPAIAVAQLARLPARGPGWTGAKLDRLCARLLVAHQLTDDVADLDEDLANGQPNAVASALGPRVLARGATDLEKVKAVQRVSDLALAELRAIRRAVPLECGLGRHVLQIEKDCAYTSAAQGRAAQLRLVASVVGRLIGRRALPGRREPPR